MNTSACEYSVLGGPFEKTAKHFLTLPNMHKALFLTHYFLTCCALNQVAYFGSWEAQDFCDAASMMLVPTQQYLNQYVVTDVPQPDVDLKTWVVVKDVDKGSLVHDGSLVWTWDTLLGEEEFVTGSSSLPGESKTRWTLSFSLQCRPTGVLCVYRNTESAELEVKHDTSAFWLYLLASGPGGFALVPAGVKLCPVAVASMIPGDGLDNDCDGRVDEETSNITDSDSDGKTGEDIAAPDVDLTTPNASKKD